MQVLWKVSTEILLLSHGFEELPNGNRKSKEKPLPSY